MLRQRTRGPSDEELVASCLSGDRAAFAAIIERYVEPLRAVAYSYAKNVSDADDIVQNTFISALASLGKLKDPTKLGGWLGRIASNLCVDWLHARNREVPLDGTLLSGIRSEALSGHPPDTPVEGLMAAEQRERVLDSLNSLPHDYRAIIALRYWSSLSYEEIADFLSVPLSTVKGRLYKAKRLLRKKLEWFIQEQERIER